MNTLKLLISIATMTCGVAVRGEDARNTSVAPAEMPKARMDLQLPAMARAELAIFSPDSTSIAVSSDDGTAYLFDANSGKLLQKFVGHTKPLSAICFASKHHQLWTGSLDGTVRVWDLESGAEKKILAKRPSNRWRIAISPDGQLAVAGSVVEIGNTIPETKDHGGEGTLQAWRIADGTAVDGLGSQGSGVFSLAFSPDGEKLGVGGVFSIDLWDVRRMKTEQSLRNTDTGIVSWIQFSSDGRLISSNCTDVCSLVRAWVWDQTRNGRPFALAEAVDTRPVMEVSGPIFFLPRDTKLMALRSDGIIDVFDVAARTCLGKLKCGDQLQIRSLDLSHDGTMILASVSDGSVRLWTTASVLAEIGSQNTQISAPTKK